MPLLARLLFGLMQRITRRAGLPEETPAAIVHLATSEMRAVDGSPADDLPLAIRVHPDDNPRDPDARRYIKDDSGTKPWQPITGWPRHMAEAQESEGGHLAVSDLSDDAVARFPRQPFLVAVAVIEHGRRR